MNIADVLKNIALDAWYKVTMVVAAIALVTSLFTDVKGITNFQLLLIASGIFFFSCGEWINHRKEQHIKPPNAYTGPTMVITYTLRKPVLGGIFLEIVGIALVIAGIWNVITTP